MTTAECNAKIDFCEATNGGTIIVSDYGNYAVRRYLSLSVSLQSILKIKSKFALSDRKTADLVKGLDAIATKYRIASLPGLGSDEALANWFRDEAAQGSMAALVKVTAKTNFEDFCDYAGGVLDRINEVHLSRNKIDEGKLLEMGFDVQHLSDKIYLGGSKFIKVWMQNAALILSAVRHTEKRLRRRSRKAILLKGELSPNRMLYGKELPALYFRIVGNPFRYLRINQDVGLEPDLQHAFVAMAASAIGAENLTAFQIQKHSNSYNLQSKRGRPKKKNQGIRNSQKG